MRHVLWRRSTVPSEVSGDVLMQPVAGEGGLLQAVVVLFVLIDVILIQIMSSWCSLLQAPLVNSIVFFRFLSKLFQSSRRVGSEIYVP